MRSAPGSFHADVAEPLCEASAARGAKTSFGSPRAVAMAMAMRFRCGRTAPGVPRPHALGRSGDSSFQGRFVGPGSSSLALGVACYTRRWAKRKEKEDVMPYVAAGVFGLLALGPTLALGSMAAWWAFAIAATLGSLLYFSVAVPMMITAALIGGIVIPILATNFFIAGSLIATLLASLATAGFAGLLVWVSMGNPLPFSAPEKRERLEEAPKVMEDPFSDWDRRFAEGSKSETKARDRAS